MKRVACTRGIPLVLCVVAALAWSWWSRGPGAYRRALGSALCDAAGSHDLDLARRFLDEGADANATSGWPDACYAATRPLYAAVESGDLAMVNLLLDRGANPRTAGHDGMEPLHWAVGSPAMVRLLLDRGARAGAPDIRGETPLHYAAAGGDPETVKLLLERGVSVNARSTGFLGMRVTPLHEAASCGDAAMVRLLLSNGALPNAADRRGETPLQYALQRGPPPAPGGGGGGPAASRGAPR